LEGLKKGVTKGPLGIISLVRGRSLGGQKDQTRAKKKVVSNNSYNSG